MGCYKFLKSLFETAIICQYLGSAMSLGTSWNRFLNILNFHLIEAYLGPESTILRPCFPKNGKYWNPAINFRKIANKLANFVALQWIYVYFDTQLVCLKECTGIGSNKRLALKSERFKRSPEYCLPIALPARGRAHFVNYEAFIEVSYPILLSLPARGRAPGHILFNYEALTGAF